MKTLEETCDLATKKCVPCEGGIPRLAPKEIKKYLSDLHEWQALNNHHLYKAYSFPDFATALAFVNKVGAVAESEGHHPNITFTWGKVELTLYTHAIDGLSLNDFILAAKIDKNV